MNDQYNPYNEYTPKVTGNTSGIYNWAQWQEQQHQRSLYEEYQKEQRMLANDAAKAQIRLSEFQEKERQKEYTRELRRAQYEALSISEAGMVTIETQNLQIQAKKRQVCNFTSPNLELLCKLGDEEDNIYQIGFILNQKQRYIYLLPELSEKGTYLLRKFNSVGACIMGATLAQEKRYAKELVRLLIENCLCRQIIPVQRGLICIKGGTPILVKEDILIWQDYMKRAK